VCDIEVENTLTNDEKAVKQAEGGGRHGKKVRRSDGLPVIAKKRQPALPAIAILGTRRIQRETLRPEMSNPSITSSP